MAKLERGRPRNPENDAAILDAAVDLLIERGPAGASIEAIARRAEVAKLTVYRRWKSREELLMAALEHGRPTKPSGAASFDDLVGSIVRQLGDRRFRDLMARVIGASVDQPKLIKVYSDRHLRPRLEGLTAAIEHEIDSGNFPAGTDPSAVRDVLAGTIGLVLLEDLTTRQLRTRLGAILKQCGYRDHRRESAR